MSDIPRQIDRYPIIKILGQGGMGDVYLAFDPAAERKIAIKCIRNDLIKHRNITERFLNEAKIASQLSHPSIVPIYSIHAGEEKIYYTMPYVEGQTLKQILRETIVRQKKGQEPHPIGSSIQELLRIFLHICHAISYAHQKGFLHRDIKPENVIVGRYGEVLLLDWGLAEKVCEPSVELSEIPNQSENLTRVGKIVGTLSYMSPERAQGKKSDFLTDIYALGVIFYQILTLRLPYKRKSLKEFQKTFSEEVFIDPAENAPNRDIPQALCKISEKMLCPDAMKRYQSVDEIIQDIEKYLEGRPEWILEKEIEISRMEDFTYQETILLNPHTAITQLGPLSEWVIFMLAAGTFPGNVKINAEVEFDDNSEGLGFLFSLPSSRADEALKRGFFFWLKSENKPSAQLFLDNVCVLENRELPPVTRALICIEKIDSNVFISINEKPIFTYVGHIPIVGSQIGLICKDMRFRLKKWQVFLGSQNAMVNCLSMPDASFAEKNFSKALYEYRRIADSFKGKAEGREAIFRCGITLLEMSKIENTEYLRKKSYTEFEKLKSTAGAPLEYLGKSLVYKEEGELEEEAKCLEFAIRRFKNHSLIHRIHEHVIFRLHELSSHDRFGTYLFALIVIRFSGQISKLNVTPILSLLKQYLQPLEFLKTPEKTTEKEDLYYLSIQLAFWLKKPMTLIEIAKENLSQVMLNNVFLALLYLDEFACIELLLKSYPHPLFENVLHCLDLEIDEVIDHIFMDKSHPFAYEAAILYVIKRKLLDAPNRALKAFEKLNRTEFSEKTKPLLDNVYIQCLLLNDKKQSALDVISRYSLSEIQSPSSTLYPSFALLHHENKDYQPYIHKLIKEKFPMISSYIGHMFSKNLSLQDNWYENAFYFEKAQFNFYLTLIKNQISQSND